jgi:hypothetical protein
VNVLTVTVCVGSDPHELGSTLQKPRTPQVYVRDLLNHHFPLPTQYRYRFTTFLAGAQGLFAHPAVPQHSLTGTDNLEEP